MIHWHTYLKSRKFEVMKYWQYEIMSIPKMILSKQNYAICVLRQMCFTSYVCSFRLTDHSEFRHPNMWAMIVTVHWWISITLRQICYYATQCSKKWTADFRWRNYEENCNYARELFKQKFHHGRYSFVRFAEGIVNCCGARWKLTIGKIYEVDVIAKWILW